MNDAYRDHQRAFSEWLMARSIANLPGNGDAETDAAVNREHAAIRRLASVPAQIEEQVEQKLEVLVNLLTWDGGNRIWTEKPDVLLLASIWADLMRMGIGRASDWRPEWDKPEPPKK